MIRPLALRLAVALGRGGCCAAGWRVSTRCCARPPGAPSRAATGGAPRSSGSAARRCTRPIWPGRWAISPRCRDAVADRGPSRALADGLAGRSVALLNLGRIAEAAEDARRSLAVAREIGYPAGEALALARAQRRRRLRRRPATSAVQLARQAAQIPADIPGSIARVCSCLLDRRADRGRGPGRRRGASARRGWPGPGRRATCGTWRSLLTAMAILDLRAGRIAGRRGAPAGSAPDRRADRRAGLSCSTAWTAAGTCAPRPGATPRPSRSGPRTRALRPRRG